MIVAITIIGLAFYWLLLESDYLRIRLMIGEPSTPKYARYKAYNAMSKRKYYSGSIHEGNNYPVDYSPNGEQEYTIVLNPGIDNILCGWEWLDKHCADLVDYQPDIYLETGGVRYSMTIKQPSILKDVMRVNKLTKKQKQAYA
uniref:Uncharacterized protein n=1 Tax=viral metagenome TaxID=1070528 RepID=A0A6M3IDV6_9ZZZZ